MRLFSYKDRPVHLGAYPLERLKRTSAPPDLSGLLPEPGLTYRREDDPRSIVNAMAKYAAMLDAIRDGMVKKERGILPSDREERSNHLKAFSYYHDTSQAGICALTPQHFLQEPIYNREIGDLADDLRGKQTQTLAAGIDVVMAELRETMESPPSRIDHHTHALVLLYEFPRDPTEHEVGGEWIQSAQRERASLRAAETAVVLANYVRLLGYDARGHSASCTDVDLNKLAVSAGLGRVTETPDGAVVENPYLGRAFGLAAVTTTFELASDRPLAPDQELGFADRWRSHGPSWWLGKDFEKSAFNNRAFGNRRFVDGRFPFERSKRTDEPSTFIDEPRVARVPKRSDMFARAIFGDMGKHVQEGAKNGNYVRKSPASFAPRRPLAAFVLLQDGPSARSIDPSACDKRRNAENVKAALHFLGADAVGISRCPDWAYYSHNALGEPLEPYHPSAISVVIDQGHETMEGASGDDWIACSQSMRAYLRFSLLGGIVAEHIRNLGYEARSHTVMDGEVLQPPLLLLSGLGEVSRIGEVILNPFLGPRLKSGAITTDMPLEYDRPIDFGLQNFCESCNKCARECPSGAITAGPKTMFNGYEIWKSDSQKCSTYRITQAAGAMCGRCMKTCPWNLEGLFAEAPFRWAATHLPFLAKYLAKLDDRLGNGSINPVKKWWWDLEMVDEGPYTLSTNGTNTRDLQLDLELKPEDQTLAVYPANLAPHPYPFPFPMDREAGIQAHRELLSPEEYRRRLARGETDGLAHEYSLPHGPPPVVRVEVTRVDRLTESVSRYELQSIDRSPLPKFEAGAHIDVVVAPEYFRQYSLAGDPADDSRYILGVLNEPDGRGGSALLHRIFQPGRRVFISRPENHFPLEEGAHYSLLLGGGIGITPLIAMAHRLHALGKAFSMHYSCSSRDEAAFLEEIERAPWASRVTLHLTDEGSRADLGRILSQYHDGFHLYTCGADRYMNAVVEAAQTVGWPEDAVHKEYFAAPEIPDYENHPFVLKLASSGETIEVPADKSAADALLAAGHHVDVKCSDGICGVCKCSVLSGEVEHRDFVLSQAQRDRAMILCQSRAKAKDGLIEIAL